MAKWLQPREIMDNSNQNQFIRKIRSALGNTSSRNAYPDGLFADSPPKGADKALHRIKNRTGRERQKLLEGLMVEAEAINLNVIPKKSPALVTADITRLVMEKNPEWGDKKSVVAWRHPLIDKLDLKNALAKQDIPVYFIEMNDGEDSMSHDSLPRRSMRERVIGSYIGVTSADFCIAESATMVMKTRPGQARSVSLVPSIHIAVIRMEQIIASLKELYTILKWDAKERAEGLTNCMTFISGPSKTADIEATMVHGAHGPREVFLYVITG